MTPLTLTAMFGSYPKTAALKEQRIASDRVALDIAPIDTAQKAFKDVVRNHRFDVAELAIVTYLLAHDAGHRYCLLPFVMNGNFHHKSIYTRADDVFGPTELEGKRVAMRSYSQTTPTWVRGILCDEYGLNLSEVEWYSQQGAHVAEYRDPAWVRNLAPEWGLEEALLAGEVDVIIAGSALQNPDKLRHLIDEPFAAANAWHARTGIIPINHMVVVKAELAESNPEAVRDVFQMLVASRQAGESIPAAGSRDLQPIGFDAIHASLEKIIQYAYDQQMISTCYSPEALYGNVLGILKP